MSSVSHISFGESLRKHRKKAAMPLRKVASLLNMDQSTLSKIERNERRPNAEFIRQVSLILQISEQALRIDFMSDLIAYELRDEDNSADVLRVAEEKLAYLQWSKSRS